MLMRLANGSKSNELGRASCCACNLFYSFRLGALLDKDVRVSNYWSLREKGLICSSYLDALSGYLTTRFENSTDISFLFDSIDFSMKLEEEAEATLLELANN